MYLAYLERDMDEKYSSFSNDKINVMKLDDNSDQFSKKKKQRKTIMKRESFKLVIIYLIAFNYIRE